MTTKTTSDGRGDALLSLIAAALIVTVAAEAAFIHWATWTLLPLIMVFVMLAAAGVVSAVGRLIEHGELVTARPSREEPKAAPAEVTQPAKPALLTR